MRPNRIGQLIADLSVELVTGLGHAHGWLCLFKGGKKEEAPDLVHIGASQNGGSAA